MYIGNNNRLKELVEYIEKNLTEEIEYALKGTQLDERLIEGECIQVYGKYTIIYLQQF